MNAYKRIIGTYNGNKDIYTLLYYIQTRFSCFIAVRILLYIKVATIKNKGINTK